MSLRSDIVEGARSFATGYDAGFLTPVIVALLRGHDLRHRDTEGRLLVAAPGARCTLTRVDERMTGDAYDVGRAFYLLAGWQTASRIAEDALDKHRVCRPDDWSHEEPAVAVLEWPMTRVDERQPDPRDKPDERLRAAVEQVTPEELEAAARRKEAQTARLHPVRYGR